MVINYGHFDLHNFYLFVFMFSAFISILTVFIQFKIKNIIEDVSVTIKVADFTGHLDNTSQNHIEHHDLKMIVS
jgi:hypothetical protein